MVSEFKRRQIQKGTISTVTAFFCIWFLFQQKKKLSCKFATDFDHPWSSMSFNSKHLSFWIRLLPVLKVILSVKKQFLYYQPTCPVATVFAAININNNEWYVNGHKKVCWNHYQSVPRRSVNSNNILVLCHICLKIPW